MAYSLVISYNADVLYCGDDIDTSNVKGKGLEILVNECCKDKHEPGISCLDTPNTAKHRSYYATSEITKSDGYCCRCATNLYGNAQVICRYCTCILHKACLTAKEINKLHD